MVDILQHLLRGERGPTDVGAAVLFIHRRAFPKLASRVRKAVRLWGAPPFGLILQYYNNTNSPIVVTSEKFILRGRINDDLESLSLHCDSSYHSTDRSRRYLVTSENVVRWVKFIHSTYRKIEEIVERNTIYGERVKVRPLSTTDAKVLVEAMNVLTVLLQAKALLTAIFSMVGLKRFMMAKFLVASMPPMSLYTNVMSYIPSS